MMKWAVITLGFCFSTTASALQPDPSALSEAGACPASPSIQDAFGAYKDAKALRHKADAFLHAQRAYRLAAQKCSDDEPLLAALSFEYAKAAAFYSEPIAVDLFQRAITLYGDVYGVDAPELVPVLAAGGDEALLRDEPELAYQYFDTARDILAKHDTVHALSPAVVSMGLARLHHRSGELARADRFAGEAIEILERSVDVVPAPEQAKLYYYFGQVKRSRGENESALDAYTKALDMLLPRFPRERLVLTLHKRLVEINYKIGNFEALAKHCVAAELWEDHRNMGIYWPIFDPAGRLGPTSQEPISGQILAGFTKGPDCRIRDIKIHKTRGISVTDAKALLENAYFTPRIRNGKIAEDQYVEQLNINVTQPPRNR